MLSGRCGRSLSHGVLHRRLTWVKSGSTANGAGPSPLVIILDQCEEAYTRPYNPDVADHAGGEAETRDKAGPEAELCEFLDNAACLVMHPGDPKGN